MNRYDEIKSAIKTGMAQACEDMNSFCDKPEKTFNAEYLFTVAAARAISDLNGPPGDPYKIKIEHNTKELERDCLRPFLRGRGAGIQSTKSVMRHQHPIPNVSRKGRVDIAVYDDGISTGYLGDKPLCVIELKRFNPQNHLVLKDLKRNLQFHRLQGATGASVLSFSFFAALYSKAVKSAAKNPGAIAAAYKKLLAQLGTVNDFTLDIETFTVSLDDQGRLLEEVHEMVIDTSSMHHYIGVIVSIRKLSIANGASDEEGKLKAA